MAGTPLRYDTQKIVAGQVGQLWAGVAVPAAGAKLSLAVDGTPDATANPNCTHLGMTKEGATAAFEISKADYFADEFPYPIKTVIEQVNGSLAGSLLQVLDFKAMEYLTYGFGTHTVPPVGTTEEIKLGISALQYKSIALIWPTEADPTKFAVLQIYDAINTGGLNFKVSRKGMAEAAFKFEGRAIGSRAAIDCFGNFWYQT